MSSFSVNFALVVVVVAFVVQVQHRSMCEPNIGVALADR